MAGEQQNPGAMIQGCAALAKLCGFYAPEGRAPEADDESTKIAARFGSMTDAQLIAIGRGSHRQSV